MKTLASVARDAIAHFGGDPGLERRFSGGDASKFWGQFTVAELRRELGDWKRELKDSTNTKEVREAESNIAAIEKEITSRSGDSLSSVARDALTSDNADLKNRALNLLEKLDTAWVGRSGGIDKVDELKRMFLSAPNDDANLTRFIYQAKSFLNSRDSLADLVDRVRGGIREQTEDAKGGMLELEITIPVGQDVTRHKRGLGASGFRRKGERVTRSGATILEGEAENSSYVVGYCMSNGLNLRNIG